MHRAAPDLVAGPAGKVLPTETTNPVNPDNMDQSVLDLGVVVDPRGRGFAGETLHLEKDRSCANDWHKWVLMTEQDTNFITIALLGQKGQAYRTNVRIAARRCAVPVIRIRHLAIVVALPAPTFLPTGSKR